MRATTHHPRPASRLLLGTLVVAAVGGCGARVIGLQSDSSFTAQNLSRDGIAVGGVTSFVGKDDRGTQSRMTSLLRESIIREQPEIAVPPIDLFPRSLGQEAYGKLLADYRLTGEIAEAWLEQLSAAAGGVQYAVFARIELDTVMRYRDRKSDVDTTTYKVSRHIGTAFQVYDLTRKISVWSGYISETRDRQKNVWEEREESQGVLGDIIDEIIESTVEDALGQTDTSRYPKPPGLTEVLRPIFEGFAGRLPK